MLEMRLYGQTACHAAVNDHLRAKLMIKMRQKARALTPNCLLLEATAQYVHERTLAATHVSRE